MLQSKKLILRMFGCILVMDCFFTALKGIQLRASPLKLLQETSGQNRREKNT
jgi:hypothetical protein